ncbi:MAG: hypothetical protein Q9162_007077 [Coniocarpon cinnabarinum]
MDGDIKPPDKFALHAACRDGHFETVEALLNTNPRLATRRDDDDRLPVHWACSYNHLHIAQLLAAQKSFDVDAKDGLGWTALMIACNIKDSDALVDFLLTKDADVNAKNSNGQTALHFCASKSHLDIARKLVSKGATARVKDKRQQLPLHRAAAVGSVPMIKLLLGRQSPVDATDMDGMTALHQAVVEGHGDAALELIKAGAVASKRDVDGRLPIDCAPDDKVRDFVLREAEKEGVEMLDG